MLHVDINKLYVDIILLHVDIHCNLLYLACRRQSYATTVVNTKIKRKKNLSRRFGIELWLMPLDFTAASNRTDTFLILKKRSA